MKVICVDDDFPGLKSIVKTCKGMDDAVFEYGFDSVTDAIDWYRRQGELPLAVMDVEDTSPRVRIKTFGNFDIFLDGKLISFHRSRAKEVLAYLVDRQGSGATRGEIFAVLWEDDDYSRSKQKQLDVIIRSLKQTLEDYGISDILEIIRGELRVVPERVDCDLYRFFEGDESAVGSYRGEYMSMYSWAMMTEAYIDQLMILRK